MKSEIIQVGQIGIRFPLESADTNGAVAIFEFTVPAGAKVPVPHSHQHYERDHLWCGRRGDVHRGGKTGGHWPGGISFHSARGGSCFNNLKPTAVKALAIITPALLVPDFFRQAAAIVNAGGPPDVEKLKAVLLKHGLVPALSPGVTR